MRETPKARQAWNDYLAMGSDRSLEKLAVHYCSTRSEYANSTPKTLRRLLVRWSAAHGWQARLAEIAEQERAAIVARGIADKQNRIDAANDRWRRMRRVIEERGGDPLMAEVAGGKTGLLVASPRLVKVFESGADGDELTPTKQSVVLYEYAVDTGLLKELREHEKQVAVELQQWTEKRELDATESFIQALKEFGRGSGTG